MHLVLETIETTRARHEICTPQCKWSGVILCNEGLILFWLLRRHRKKLGFYKHILH